MRNLDERIKLVGLVPRNSRFDISIDLEFAKKALICIEYLSLYGDFDEDKDDALSNIYRISHVALGRCSANHDDWIQLVNDLYSDLIKSGRV